jgi:hypothetical protein
LKFNIKEKLDKINPIKKNADGKRTFFGKKEDGEGTNKFFDKVGDYFNPEPQKERVLRHEDFNAAGDVYYASVSAFYKVGERLLWLILAIFMIFSVVTNYKEITFDNFFYLLKDFSSAADSEVPQYQVLSYDSDSRQTFALYRGGLVSASPSAVSVFTAGGRRTLKSNNEYYSPNIVCCDKYVLVYDSAGSAFSVYNSFSQVYTEQLDSPITNATFAPDGSFAIATKNEDGKAVIRFYGKDLKYRGNVPDSKYVMDMSLSADGDRFCKVSYQAGTGKGLSTLTLYDIASKHFTGTDLIVIILDKSRSGEVEHTIICQVHSQLNVLTIHTVDIIYAVESLVKHLISRSNLCCVIYQLHRLRHISTRSLELRLIGTTNSKYYSCQYE